MQVLSHADLSPDQLLSAIAGQHPDLRDTWADGGWQLCTIDATRGHSRDRSLMHPCYILIQADDYWVFNHRPHGLLELVLGSLDLSFPCVLPQMINFPVLQAFLSPLLPHGLSCLSLQMWHNGAAVDYQLVSCFNGFFIQVVVEVNNILMENTRLAAPLIIPQLHIDQMVLTVFFALCCLGKIPGGAPFSQLHKSGNGSRVDRPNKIAAATNSYTGGDGKMKRMLEPSIKLIG